MNTFASFQYFKIFCPARGMVNEAQNYGSGIILFAGFFYFYDIRVSVHCFSLAPNTIFPGAKKQRRTKNSKWDQPSIPKATSDKIKKALSGYHLTCDDIRVGSVCIKAKVFAMQTKAKKLVFNRLGVSTNQIK